MTVIQIANVKKTFKTKRSSSSALKGVSLNINQGEMVALIGPSGSGKSTLLRHLSGLTLADKGSDSSIDILGKNIQHKGKLGKDIRVSRSQIGNVFQQFNLINRLSVLTNVLIGGLSKVPSYRSLLGIFTAAEKHSALAALTRVGLQDYALHRASDLSGGQQQRVAIARALLQKAKVILADEPIASLDPEASRLVMQILKNINEQDGITIVVTLHQVDYAQQYCRRAIALKDGELYFDSPIQDIDNTGLNNLYGGTEHNNTHSVIPISSNSAQKTQPPKLKTA
ncbi:phosphonate ABC transporter ATP-binding protein [Gammaproteobacteria bacterium AS21]